MIQINVNYIGDPGSDLVEWVIDTGTRYPGVKDLPGRMVFRTTQPEPSPFGSHIEWRGQILAYLGVPADGFVGEAGMSPFPPYPAMHPALLTFSATVGSVQILGDHFEVNGKRWLVRGVDGFCDLSILLEQGHGALEPQLRQAQDLGARLRRVFGCIKNIRQLNPFSYGDAYFAAITELFTLYASYGLWGEFDALVDTGYWGFSLGDCQSLWARVTNTLAPIANRFLSLTNEYDHGGNLVGGLNDYPRPPFALCSQGSAVSDAPPPRPGWGIREFHALKPWPKIFLCEDMLFNREGVDADGTRWGDPKPTYLSECPRFEEGNPYTDERLARTLALESAAFGEGMVFHSQPGRDGQMLGSRVASCAKTAMDLLIKIEG